GGGTEEVADLQVVVHELVAECVFLATILEVARLVVLEIVERLTVLLDLGFLCVEAVGDQDHDDEDAEKRKHEPHRTEQLALAWLEFVPLGLEGFVPGHAYSSSPVAP